MLRTDTDSIRIREPSDTGDSHENEGFLKSAWHKLTGKHDGKKHDDKPEEKREEGKQQSDSSKNDDQKS